MSTYGKAVVGGIILFTVITAIALFTLPPKYGVSLFIMDIAVIIFAFLVWLNNKYYDEQIGTRILSINDKDFIYAVIARQMNMHGANDIKDKGNVIEFYKGKNKAGEVRFRTDENGNPIKVDGKWVIEVVAPEYILHNIDNELWSLIGTKQ